MSLFTEKDYLCHSLFYSANLIAALDRLSVTTTTTKKEKRTKNDKQTHTKRYHYLCDAFHYSNRVYIFEAYFLWAVIFLDAL